MHVLIAEPSPNGGKILRCECGFFISKTPAVLGKRIHGMDREDYFSEVRMIHVAHRSKCGCSDLTSKLSDPIFRLVEDDLYGKMIGFA